MASRQSNNHSGSGLVLVLLTCCLLLLAGCLAKKPATPRRDSPSVAGAGETFGGQWHDYYKRGIALAEDGRQREAMADFREAIAGRDKDEWQTDIDQGRAMDYFPHRELGILHVARKEYSSAILELEKSLASAPSAKASFYLSQARAGKTAGDAPDRTPPELFIEGSITPEVTSECRTIISGVATDDNYVAGLSVAGRQLPVEVPEKNKVFRATIDLADGKNAIQALATDLAGNIGETIRHISCDRRGPLIEIEELTVKEDRQVKVRGNVRDANGLRSLNINGEPWPITGKAPGYNFDFTLPDGRITIVAVDQGGNLTGARVRKDELDLPIDDSVLTPLPQPSSELDLKPPTITIEGIGNEVETSSDTLQLTGQISDDSLLVYISINGEEISNRRGRRIFFSQQRSLREGKNDFRIIAADASGNKASQTITVIRTVTPGRGMDARLRLALLPFTAISDRPVQTHDIQELLQNSFKEQARFNLVSHEQVTAACRELHLSPGTLLSPNDAAKAGRLLGAHAVLTGRIMIHRDMLEIVGMLIDSDSAALIARNDVFGPAAGNAGKESLVAGLADKFSRNFPLAEGDLLEAGDQEVLVNLGVKDRITPLARFICYRQPPPARHPVTGVLLTSSPEIVGELLVTEVGKKSSRARILEKKGYLLVGDKVIAR